MTLPAVALEAGHGAELSRAALIARAAEALDLTLERIVEDDDRMGLTELVRRIQTHARSATLDLEVADVPRVIYTVIALRLLKERSARMIAAGGPFPG